MKKRIKNAHRNRKYDLIPYHVIKAASEEDIDAIMQIVKHYEGYIRKLSTRYMYDESGTLRCYIDEELRLRLKTKLIEKVLSFEI